MWGYGWIQNLRMGAASGVTPIWTQPWQAQRTSVLWWWNSGASPVLPAVEKSVCGGGVELLVVLVLLSSSTRKNATTTIVIVYPFWFGCECKTTPFPYTLSLSSSSEFHPPISFQHLASGVPRKHESLRCVVVKGGGDCECLSVCSLCKGCDRAWSFSPFFCFWSVGLLWPLKITIKSWDYRDQRQTKKSQRPTNNWHASGTPISTQTKIGPRLKRPSKKSQRVRFDCKGDTFW